MIDDMTLRKLSPTTHRNYIHAVKDFTRFFGQSPDAASAEDLRRYRLHLVQQGISSTTLNATLTGLRFFFEITLDRPGMMKHTSHVHEPRKLPVILSAEEVGRLLQAAGSLKYQAALGIACGASPRASSALTHHRHLHCIVPGGGISSDGQRWVPCKCGFFPPVRVLSRLFPHRFLERLHAAYQAGRLQCSVPARRTGRDRRLRCLATPASPHRVGGSTPRAPSLAPSLYWPFCRAIPTRHTSAVSFPEAFRRLPVRRCNPVGILP